VGGAGNDAALRLYEAAGFTIRDKSSDQLALTRALQ
jgi:hypothetical protein